MEEYFIFARFAISANVISLIYVLMSPTQHTSSSHHREIVLINLL